MRTTTLTTAALLGLTLLAPTQAATAAGRDLPGRARHHRRHTRGPRGRHRGRRRHRVRRRVVGEVRRRRRPGLHPADGGRPARQRRRGRRGRGRRHRRLRGRAQQLRGSRSVPGVDHLPRAAAGRTGSRPASRTPSWPTGATTSSTTASSPARPCPRPSARRSANRSSGLDQGDRAGRRIVHRRARRARSASVAACVYHLRHLPADALRRRPARPARRFARAWTASRSDRCGLGVVEGRGGNDDILHIRDDALRKEGCEPADARRRRRRQGHHPRHHQRRRPARRRRQGLDQGPQGHRPRRRWAPDATPASPSAPAPASADARRDAPTSVTAWRDGAGGVRTSAAKPTAPPSAPSTTPPWPAPRCARG